MGVLEVVPILIKKTQLGDNISKSSGLTISNILQLFSEPEELYVKLNILIAQFFNSRRSSPYESHHLVDNDFYVLVGSVGSHTILRSFTILHTILQFLRFLCDSLWGGIIKSCDPMIHIAILTTMVAPNGCEDCFHEWEFRKGCLYGSTLRFLH